MHAIFLLSVDLFLLCIANIAVSILSLGPHPTSLEFIEILPFAGWTLTAAVPVILIAGLNRTLWRFTSFHDCLRIFIAVLAIIALAIMATTAFSSLQSVPQPLIALQIICMTGALIGVRGWMRLKYIRRQRRNYAKRISMDKRDSVIIVGVNAATSHILRCIAERMEPRIAVAGIISENHQHRGRLFGTHPILGQPDKIERIVQDLKIHGVQVNRIVLTEPLSRLSENTRRALAQAERDLHIAIDNIHDTFELGIDPEKRGDNAIAASTPYRPLIPKSSVRQSYLFWKRAFDIVVSIAIAVCLLPLALLVSALTWIDVGHPIIFWQQRPGTNGRPIKVLKFRTMRTARGANGEHLSDQQRLSAIGKFLRRMRLDELPQVLNVFTGDMSMVGPRPLLPVDQSPKFRARLDMKPGLTGWAQINGGRHLTINDKAALDLWYVRHTSLMLDLRILLQTARTILIGERVNTTTIRQARIELGKLSWIETTVSRELRSVMFRPYQPRSQLSQSLSIADIHLVTLRPELEGLIVPSKFYGAAAVGRPILFIGATDGELARVISRHGCGLSIPNTNAATLAEAIIALAQEPRRSQEMGKRARIASENCYTKQLAIHAWWNILNAPSTSIINHNAMSEKYLLKSDKI